MIDYLVNLKNKKLFRYFIYIFIILYLILLLSAVLKVHAYSFNNNNKIANDFLAYYTGGTLALKDPNILYNFNKQFEIQEELNSITKYTFLPYVYPPITAYLISPLTLLDFKQANLIWTIINFTTLCLFLFAIYKFYKSYDWWTRIAFVILIAFFPAIKTNFGLGQISLFIGIGILFSWYLYTKNKDFLSGLVLSIFFIKLQYLPLPLIILTFHRNLKMLFGFISGVFILLFASFFTTGISGLNNYFIQLKTFNGWIDEFARDFDYHINIQSGISHIFGIGEPISLYLYILSSSIIGIFIIYIWYKKIDKISYASNLRWVLMLIAVLVISPHTNLQDYVLVVIAFIILVPKDSLKYKTIPRSLKFFVISIFPMSLLFLNYPPALKIIYLVYLIIFISVLVFEILNPKEKKKKGQKQLSSGI